MAARSLSQSVHAPPAVTRAAIYARVSTLNGQNPDVQTREMEEYGQRRGFEIFGEPANVLVDDTGNAWLTGFGIASQLPHERQSPEAPEFIAGTLAYMAPEQTGRLNRSIDSRSDLYFLGV